MDKCKFANGITIKPDGTNELDPCVYEDVEIHTNCTVIISKCTKCGNLEISWIKNEGCESYDPRTNESLYGTCEDRNGDE